MTSNAALTAHGLTCTRGGRVLFRDVNLALDVGGLLYVLGENGSGKSSLLRLIAGLLSPEQGDVCWGDEKITQLKDNYHASLFYLGHLNGLKDDLTAIENLQMNASLVGALINETHALKALEAMDIKKCAHLPVRVLSQGQKKRVALARLWLTQSTLWILDEPFAALDTISVERLTTHLSQHLCHGGLAILTTHQNVTVQARTTQTLRLGA